MRIKKAFRNICATCRHLQVVETGREFDKIVDTEFTKFSCRMLGWQKREFYLMAPVDQDLSENQPRKCPFWEPWDETDETTKTGPDNSTPAPEES